jgi:hypothetical protein
MYWQKQLYKINIDDDDYQSKKKELIVIKEKNSLKNHLWKSRFKNDKEVRGEFDKNTFTIWRRNSRWNGIFYPIFKGEKLEIDGTKVLVIKTRFNIFANLIVLTVTMYISFFIIDKVLMQGTLELTFVLKRTLIGGIIFSLFQIVPAVCYYPLKKQTLKGLEDYFKLTKLK